MREQDLEEDVAVFVVVAVAGFGLCGLLVVVEVVLLLSSVPRVEERGLVFVERRAEGGLSCQVADCGWGGGVRWGGG